LLTEKDDATRDAIVATRRETWRELVATAYGFDAETDIPTLSIVEARELMHAVSSRMVEPDLLLAVQSQTAKINGTLSCVCIVCSDICDEMFTDDCVSTFVGSPVSWRLEQCLRLPIIEFGTVQ
jgi:hypothetical protein